MADIRENEKSYRVLFGQYNPVIGLNTVTWTLRVVLIVYRCIQNKGTKRPEKAPHPWAFYTVHFRLLIFTQKNSDKLCSLFIMDGVISFSKYCGLNSFMISSSVRGKVYYSSMLGDIFNILN